MLHNNVWHMLFQRRKDSEAQPGTATSLTATSIFSTASNVKGAESTLDDGSRGGGAPPRQSSRRSHVGKRGHRSSTPSSKVGRSVPGTSTSNVSRIVWKVPKLSQLELFKYLQNWDKVNSTLNVIFISVNKHLWTDMVIYLVIFNKLKRGFLVIVWEERQNYNGLHSYVWYQGTRLWHWGHFFKWR